MGKRILLVDDDKTLIKLLEDFLGAQGFDIFVAYDGEEALSLFEDTRPDLILLDVMLPKINGYSFLFELKKLNKGSACPVIVLTSKDSLEDIFKAEGVKEYIVKPFSNADLLEKIQKYV